MPPHVSFARTLLPTITYPKAKGVTVCLCGSHAAYLTRHFQPLLTPPMKYASRFFRFSLLKTIFWETQAFISGESVFLLVLMRCTGAELENLKDFLFSAL